jgi:uncharacterized protein YjbI with pentapeptide repeats
MLVMSPTSDDLGDRNLRGADLRQWAREGGSLWGADLAGADLRGARLIAVDLRGCDLEGARLDGALLQRCDLQGADLTAAQLAQATLVDNRWEGATLSGADCRDALAFPAWPSAISEASHVPAAVGDVPRAAVLSLGRALSLLVRDGDSADEAAVADAIDEALALAPGWPRALRERAASARRAASVAAAAASQMLAAYVAEEAYTLRVAAEPENVLAWARLGLLRARLGDGAGALMAVEQVARLADATSGLAEQRELQALVPWLLEQSFAYPQLLEQAESAPPEDASWLRLRSRALQAARAPQLDAVLDTLARVATDELSRRELDLRRALQTRACVARAPAPATADAALPPELQPMAEKLQGTQMASAGSLRAMGITPRGSVLWQVAAGDIVELTTSFRALERTLAQSSPKGPSWRCVGEAEALVFNRAPAWLIRYQSSPSLPRPQPFVWSRASLEQRLAAGPDADFVAGLPSPLRARVATTARAAWSRVAGAAAAMFAREDEPTWVRPLMLPTTTGQCLPFGGGITAPDWLASLVGCLDRDDEREAFARTRVLLADRAAAPALEKVRDAVGGDVAEAGLVAWLLGPAADEIALLVDAELLFDSAARRVRVRALEMLMFRLELVARGVLGYWLR